MSPFVNGFIIFSLIITATYFFGLFVQIIEFRGNDCEMTYMFEYPQFVKIANPIDEHYPKYGLFAYSEGRATEKTRNMYFDGIPVLFIPGNAGSHKQGRSYSSAALRKAIHSRTPFHFDYFTVDLNEELSGLNGALLYDQLFYINASIYRILDLYNERKNPPKSVVLIGHSMGGVIARHLVSDLPSGSNLVSIVITLATPHMRSPIVMDHFTHYFYKEINKTKTNTTFISLSGGHRDFLVPSYLTFTHETNSLDVMSTQFPRSWLDADHVCILWCKQIVLIVNRALFDVVDPKSKQISNNATLIKNIFYHHLVKHNGIKPKLHSSYDLKANINNQGEWIENFGRQYTVTVPSYASKTYFYMVRLVNQPLHEGATIVGINLDTANWVFACGAHIPQGNYRVCEEFRHLTHLSEIAVSRFLKRRSITLNLHELMRNDSTLTHVVLRVPPTDNTIMFHVDVYNVTEREFNITLPNIINLKKQVLISETSEKAVHYKINLTNLYHVMHSYHLYVDAINCTNNARHASATLMVPWGHQEQHKIFTKDDSKPFHLRLYRSRPSGFVNNSAKLILTLDPTCRYRISIQSWIPGFLSNLARLYTPMLGVNIAAVILMTFTAQLKSMDIRVIEMSNCYSFFKALIEGSKPYYILTTVKLIARALSCRPLSLIFPTPDWFYMSQEGIDFFVLPLVLYVCSVGLVWILGIFLSISLVCFETTVHKFTMRFLSRSVAFTFGYSEHLMSALHKLPFIVALALIFLTLTTSGGLALCVGVVFYFLRLTHMAQDYIEELVWAKVESFLSLFRKAKVDKDDEEHAQSKDSDQSESEDSEKVEDENKGEDKIKSENKDINKDDDGGKVEVEAKSEAKAEDTDDKIKGENKDIVKGEDIKKTEVDVNERKRKEEEEDEFNASELIRQLYEAENNEIEEEKDTSPNALSFHFTIFMLWTIVAIINVPSVLTWAHNFKFSPVLKSDPAFIPGLILSSCAIPLWHLDFPKIHRRFYSELSQIIFALAVTSLIYAPISIFRLNYTISAAIVIVVVHQILAPMKKKYGPDADEPTPEYNYEAIKAKLE